VNQNNASAPTPDQVASLIRGLTKLPPYEAITFRGRSADARFGRPGEVVVTTGLTATSRDVRIATENFTAPALYAIAGISGRAIEQHSQFPDEREVVFLPSTMLRVAKVARLGDLPLVIVEQLDPQRDPAVPKTDPLDEWSRSIAARFLSARRRPPLDLPHPGKFVGDID
jgi:hypothetical protein